MSVNNGQPVNAQVMNAAFLSRLQDSDTVAIVGLKNDDVASGSHVDNIQQAHNETFDAIGMTGIGDTTRKDYSSENVVSNGDSHKVSIGKLDGQFSETTGHTHDGTPGNGGPIDGSTLVNTNLLFAEFQTFAINAAAGLSVTVNSYFVGKLPTGSGSTEGVITSIPLNRCEIINASTYTYIEDANGQKVYGRLIYNGTNWILYFFTNENGTETAYTLASTDILILYREVFNQNTRPTIPSNPIEFGTLDITADIVDATSTQRGVVNTSAQQFSGEKDFLGHIKTDQITESTLNSGVTVETVLIKDGFVDGRDLSTDGTNLDGHIASTSNPHSTTAAQVGADPVGTAAAAISAHELASDPHPQYLTSTEGNGLYDALGAASTVQGNLSSHISDVANPHSVTKAQVGLDNVTNDSQLKRSAADFTTFTVKTTPVSADVILIEDSADSFNKKYCDLSTLLGGGGSTTNIITATAGENLALGDVVYISTGNSLGDTGRTAGQVYKVDCTNDYRMEFVGIVTVAALAAATCTITVGGEVAQFSGLTPGKPYFVDPATPGAVTVTPPTTPGQWIINVGTASTATAIIVNSSLASAAIKITNNSMSLSNLVINTAASYSPTISVDIILCNAAAGAQTINLPTAVGYAGKVMHIKKTDTSVNAVTIDPNGSETIDGASTKIIITQYQSIGLVSDGSNWAII